MIASLVRWALGLVVSCVLALATGARAQGVFSHQIPIKLPNGANGMQPELALTYASGSGNGIVGMGWQLAGLSQITRINYGSGINYGGTDTYGHSQVGVLTPQHDADNSYRSQERELHEVRSVRSLRRRTMLVGSLRPLWDEVLLRYDLKLEPSGARDLERPHLGALAGC